MHETEVKSTDITELGRCIRDIREQSKMTAEELAKASGIMTRPSLTRFEIGKSSSPSFDSMFAILRVIGELDIVKHSDFDFRPYSEETKNLILYFVRNDAEKVKPSYKQAILAELDKISDELPINFFQEFLSHAKWKIGMQNVNEQIAKYIKTLEMKEVAKTEEVIDYFPHRDVLQQIFKYITSLVENKDYDAAFEFTANVLLLIRIKIDALINGKGEN